ncbi:hypothetical protein [Hymenobacter elongatus]|uniref:MABP domain-containing protein n=1 Tax=Hymenobacter elongatus TaxID=877208 RepID=A0A4Z0PRJ0_9BACT|nr:hypothetical protein [Hymenobacter elongatus]TGE20135.1 hypothetical protein E5J99_00775 [Hymenobacter elongatus]
MQFSTLRFGITALAMGALSSLFSCSKEDTQEVAPKAAATTQQAVGASLTAQQLNWQKFTADVEAGRQADAFGQYVSKTTQVASTGDVRITRPKRDFVLTAGKGGIGAGGSSVGARYPVIEEPCDGCGGGGYTPPTYTFVSSENIGGSPNNPDGYILDMKLIDNNWASWQFPGYTMLNLDLNKGAGGRYIYFTFTREPYWVQFADGRPLRQFSIKTRSTNPANPSVPADHEPLWYAQNTTNSPYVGQLDLNEGAGGDYIYSYVSRHVGFGSPVREVGVVASNSSTVQPPAGWERVGVDLNKGAGGDYIYLCFKR